MKSGCLPEELCSKHCSFYKPGRDTDEACGGYLILQKLLEQKDCSSVIIEKKGISEKTENELYHAICHECPFFAADCDFALWKRNELPERQRVEFNPCGGFLYLCYGIESGCLDITLINRVM